MEAVPPFVSLLERPPGTGTWTYVRVPFRVEDTFGVKGQVKVKGTIEGVPYRGSLMPQGDGMHYLVVNKALRDAAGVTAGDRVNVTLEADIEAREADVPNDLADALRSTSGAEAAFANMSYSRQKEYADWIVSAKRPETRAGRIVKAAEMIARGQRLKG